MRRPFIVGFVLLAPLAAIAQLRPDPARAFPLVDLRIKGNRVYSERQIIEVAGLKLGQPANQQAFDAARERLIATGAFESVGLEFGPSKDGKGYRGSFEVVEVAQLYPLTFEDLPDSERHLREALRAREPLFTDQIPATRALLDRFATALQQYLGATFTDKVTAELAADGAGGLTVKFRPATPQPVVAEIEFTGNKALAASTLANAFASVAIGVSYREETIRSLLDSAVRPLYAGEGRLRVQFGSIETRPMANVKGLHVKMAIEEGPVFKFGAIESKVPVIPAKKVLQAAALKSGNIADFKLVQKGIDAVQKELASEGYIHSRTTTERVLHDEQKTVDLAFVSELGPQFHMGKLNVAGLDVVTEPAVRKLWSMKEGDPYNAGYPQYFLDRIKEDGYFDNLAHTRWDQKINDKAGTVDVTLTFRGGTDPEKEKKKREREQNPQQQGPPGYMH